MIKQINICFRLFTRMTALQAVMTIWSFSPGQAQTALTGLLDTARELRFRDLSESSRMADSVYQQAMVFHNDLVACDALMLLGWNAQTSGDYKLSNTYFQKILILAPPGYDNAKLGMANSGMGLNYSAMGDFQAAMPFVLRFDSLFENIPMTYTHIQPKLQLGELYENMHHVDKAEKYYQLAYNTAFAKGNHFQKVMALYYLLDFNLIRQGKTGYAKELQEYLSLIEKRNPDRTLHWGHAQMLFVGMTPEEKIHFLEKTRKELLSSEFHVSRYFSTSELIDAYLTQGKYSEALNLALEDLDFFRTQQNTAWMLNLHARLSDLYKKSGQPEEALKHLQKYSDLRNNLHALDVAKYVDSLEIMYNTAQQETQIAQQETQLMQQRQQKQILLIALFAVFCSGSLIILFLWNRNRFTSRLAEKNAQLQSQKILQLENEKKLLALSSMIGGQEAERKRIAQDLHDGLGGLLSSVKAQLNILRHRMDQPGSMELYRRANELIDNASTELRRIAYNMMPSSLSRLGLEAALEDFCADLETDHPLDINLQLFGLRDRLNETTEIMLYRIVQELCTNVVKHAQASRLLIQINKVEDDLYLIVEDNGIGMDPGALDYANGMGMKSIESRVKFLNGTMDVGSGTVSGTCITVHFPGQYNQIISN